MTAPGELHLRGDWVRGCELPEVVFPASGTLRVLDEGIGRWDSTLLLFLRCLAADCAARGLELDLGGLPAGARRLLALADAVPARATRPPAPRAAPLHRLGLSVFRRLDAAWSGLAFFGGLVAALGRCLIGRGRFRGVEFMEVLQDCGPGALGIVSLISVLVGSILAFVGAIQLGVFGAEIYVANLVGLGMVMEMGALMTGIILAGRTGATFAAQLGTMCVNEEIDALETLGLRPIEYLVLPRVLALGLMTPLLVVYANFMGILGGFLVGLFALDMSPAVYFRQTLEFMTPWFAVQGLIKGSTYGLLVALAGCKQGLTCGRSASAVGAATTAAVVNGILLIVIADAAWTLVFMVVKP